VDHDGGRTDRSEEADGSFRATFSGRIFRVLAGRRDCGGTERREPAVDGSDVIRSAEVALAVRSGAATVRRAGGSETRPYGGRVQRRSIRGGFDGVAYRAGKSDTPPASPVAISVSL